MYVDAAADTVVSFSQQYALPKNGPTVRLITRFLEACAEFFDKHQDEGLEQQYVDDVLHELSLRRLGRHEHGTKGFKSIRDVVPESAPQPTPPSLPSALQPEPGRYGTVIMGAPTITHTREFEVMVQEQIEQGGLQARHNLIEELKS